MVREIQYTSINRVLDNLKDDALMEDLTLEQVVRHTVRFIEKHGYIKLYQDKIEDVDIHAWRGLLPCDLVSIIQVKDAKTGICLRSMTDNFPKGMQGEPPHEPCEDPMHNARPWYIPGRHVHFEEPAFKTQGRVIFTTFPEGKVTIAYRSIPVDENGFPMLLTNEKYLDALESYISMRVIRNLFRRGKVSAQVYQDAQQTYAVAARLLMSEFTLPSVSEMESLMRLWSTLIPSMKHFDNGFKDVSNREYLRRQ